MTTLVPISNQSANVSAIIATLEQLANFKRSGQTDWSSKISQAYNKLSFDIRNQKDIDITLVHNDSQGDIDQVQARKTLELIFRDIEDLDNYDVNMGKASFYSQEYETMFENLKLSVDLDEDGDIETDTEEELEKYQTRFVI